MIRAFFLAFICAAMASSAFAHDSTASYIANEGVMVTHEDATAGTLKILFDPLPLTGFGTYMDVPAAAKAAMLSNTAPYNDVDVVFISHAHRDHFSAADMLAFMAAQPEAFLVAPAQALEMMRADSSWDAALRTRMHILDMDYGDTPQTVEIDTIKATAVRIAHSGWPAPRRAAVQNMVYRVTLGDGPTVMHMGDADVRAQHYVPFEGHWRAKRTDLALPPYWFLIYEGGPEILESLNVAHSVGTHVPLSVPADLIASGADYFSISGESRAIITPPAEGCRPLTFDTNNYTVCEFSASQDIHTIHSKDGTPFENFSALNGHLKSQNQTLSFAMNGGMYHADRSPVGLFIENGLETAKLVTGKMSGNFGLTPNGVFYAGKDGAGVMETIAFKAAKLVPDYATQSGPMLVTDGAIHPKFWQGSTSKKKRNGVGVSADSSRVYFVISEDLVNFHSFASLFKDHLKTPNALYLDGTISRLYDSKTGRNDTGQSMGPIVGVIERTGDKK